MKRIWLAAIGFGLVFLVLFSVRMGFFGTLLTPPPHSVSAVPVTPSDRDTWMTVSQNGRKIGFSHSLFSKNDTGYHLKETLFMRINTMGMIHDIHMNTAGLLNPDFSLAAFDVNLDSGQFGFEARGSFADGALSLTTQSSGSAPRSSSIRMRQPPFLASGIMEVLRAANLTPGRKWSFHVFDPATMGQDNVVVTVAGEEAVRSMGRSTRATRLTLTFKGVEQQIWIDKNGDIVKESGFLGIVLEKTSRNQAMFGLPVEASEDLTRAASIASNVVFKNPDRIRRLTLKISGLPGAGAGLAGGRQSFKNGELTIEKESLSHVPRALDTERLPPDAKTLLRPAPFVQSDHPDIVHIVDTIIDDGDAPLDIARKLVAWLDGHVEKRPVVSLPDALSTLKNRAGDCNEHAVLMAALSRCAGIPADIAAGIVYTNGRFYYHAWNLLYLGQWIAVRPAFRADSRRCDTHPVFKRRAGGTTGPDAVDGRRDTGDHGLRPHERHHGQGKMIALEHMTKKYADFTAVHDLNLTVSKGEIFGFIGPNGAGKTTTIKIMGGVNAPTSGRVLISGIDMGIHPEAAKARIGFIPDRPYLYEKTDRNGVSQVYGGPLRG